MDHIFTTCARACHLELYLVARIIAIFFLLGDFAVS